MHEPVRILMSSIVDYAGLFPPAQLDMHAVMANWSRYTASDHAWMLARLVVPVARLGEFERQVIAARQSMAGAPTTAPRRAPAPTTTDAAPDSPDHAEPLTWQVSAIAGENLNADIDRIFAFNRAHAPDEPDAPAPPSETPAPLRVVIDAIEFKASSGHQIDQAMRLVPEQIEPYIEIPVSGGVDVRGMVAAMAGTGARAKVRTGGVTPESFPAVRDVAKFLAACAAADVAFKATAGLHHAIRGEHPLTYEPACPRAVMLGFLNVFLAAAFVKAAGGDRVGAEEAALVLEETNLRAFAFDRAGVTWRDRRLDTARLARVRESFATSFGSCSFEEPLAELQAAGLL